MRSRSRESGEGVVMEAVSRGGRMLSTSYAPGCRL